MKAKQYLHEKCLDYHTSFQDVAKRLNVHPNTISNWVNNPWNTGSGAWWVMAKAIGLNNYEWGILEDKITDDLEEHYHDFLKMMEESNGNLEEEESERTA